MSNLHLPNMVRAFTAAAVNRGNTDFGPVPLKKGEVWSTSAADILQSGGRAGVVRCRAGREQR